MLRRYISLALFLLLVVGGGSLIGLLNLTGPWYDALRKPVFNPPSWLFGPVWTALYVMIAIAGWRTAGRFLGGACMKVWIAQLALNFAWSPIFFTAHQIGLALAVIIALFGTIIAFISLTWRRDPVSAWLFVPYAFWVAFATALNGAIWWLN